MILCTLIGGGQHMIMNKKSLFVFIFILYVILTGVCAFASALPDVRISVGGVTHDNAVVNINVKSDEKFFDTGILFLGYDGENSMSEVCRVNLPELTASYSGSIDLNEYGVTLEPNKKYILSFSAGQNNMLGHFSENITFVTLNDTDEKNNTSTNSNYSDVSFTDNKTEMKQTNKSKAPDISVYNEKWITQDNAYIQGEIEYADGAKPSYVGMYLGTSAANMKAVWKESLPHNKNPFNIWYDIKDEVGIKLEPDTKYYYTFYAIVDGKTYKGSVRNFRTEKSEICLHSSYDENGYCANCGEEFQLQQVKSINKQMVCKKENAALHSRPYGAAPITGRSRNGQILTVSKQAVNSYGNLWYQLSDGKWIVSDYVEEQKSSSSGISLGMYTIHIRIDGKEISLQGMQPVVRNGYTLVPVRSVSNAINKNVEYDEKARTITVSDSSKKMKMTLDSRNVVYTTGYKTETGLLSTAPVIIDGNAMLPVRDVVGFFDYDISWDVSTYTININSKGYKDTAENISEYRNPLGDKNLSVTAGFYYSSGSYHGGVDFSAKDGTPLYPVQGGKVLFAGVEKRADGSPGMGGNCVLILGNDGYYYYYAHLQKINFDQIQEKNSAGKTVFKTIDNTTQIGLTGKTSGTLKNMAAHLHLTIAVPKGSSIPIPKGSGVNGTGKMDWYGNHQGTSIDGVKFLEDKGVL